MYHVSKLRPFMPDTRPNLQVLVDVRVCVMAVGELMHVQASASGGHVTPAGQYGRRQMPLSHTSPGEQDWLQAPQEPVSLFRSVQVPVSPAKAKHLTRSAEHPFNGESGAGS